MNSIKLIHVLSFLLLLWGSTSVQAEVVVAEDFFYSQPTKPFGPGGGFNGQDYGGGQNGGSGSWLGRWVSVGDGIITGTDISEEAFDLETDVFTGATRNGLSVNWLERGYSLQGVDDDATLYFGITMRSNNEFAQPNAAFSINDPAGPARIGMGFAEAGFQAFLGDPNDNGDFDLIPGPELTDGLDAHRLVGKLEINARGSDERLTVWLDPTDEETAEETAFIEVDVVGGLDDFNGSLRLDHAGSGGVMFWDDLAIGTSWASVAEVEVPRLTLLADGESREVRYKNETGAPIDVTFLQLETEERLFDTRWESLAERGQGGFVENSPNRNRLTESSFDGQYTLEEGQSVSWGRIFRGREEDLIAHVGTTDGLLNLANVVYGPIEDEEIDADFNDDGVVDVADVDALCTQIAATTNDGAFDLTQDGVVDTADMDQFLSEVPSLYGDSNLDGTVDFADFLTLSSGFSQSGTWSTGDFDCDDDVAFGDFLSLSDNFSQSAAASESVPEPASVLLGLLAVIVGWGQRRKKSRA